MPPAAAAYFVRAFEEYEAGASSGMTLDKALGVAATAGAGPWWIQEGRVRRDAALRELHRTCFASQPPTEAAKLITRLADRRRRATWPPTGPHEQLIDTALRAGPKFPKARRLASILGNSVPA